MLLFRFPSNRREPPVIDIDDQALHPAPNKVFPAGRGARGLCTGSEILGWHMKTQKEGAPGSSPPRRFWRFCISALISHHDASSSSHDGGRPPLPRGRSRGEGGGAFSRSIVASPPPPTSNILYTNTIVSHRIASYRRARSASHGSKFRFDSGLTTHSNRRHHSMYHIHIHRHTYTQTHSQAAHVHEAGCGCRLLHPLPDRPDDALQFIQSTPERLTTQPRPLAERR